MDVFVIGVALSDVAGQAVDGQVHAAQAHGLGDLLLAEDADFGVGVAPAALDELAALHEHAAGAVSGVQQAAVEGADHLDDEPDEAGGGEEFAALLALAHGEPAEEVLVDLAEGIAGDIQRDGVEGAQQTDECGVVQAVVGLGQDVAQVVVLCLDGAHGVVDRFADVGAFGEGDQAGEAGLVGQVDDAAGLIVDLADGSAAGVAVGGQFTLGHGELVVGEAQEDQAQDGHGVFR